ncbi:MAG: 4-diphosphocytidyl-2C-methyl-D-erythritol kinase, partial [Gammaproteobacteria bacterium]
MGIERRAPKNSVGCVLTHSIKLPGKVFKKGTVLSPDLVSELKDYRFETVTVLTPSTTDCHEDLAAQQITGRLKLLDLIPKKGIGGRINLVAGSAGLFCFDVDKIHELNRVSESITIATLPDKTPVAAGQLVATLKIIPFFVAKEDLSHALSVAEGVSLHLRPWSTSLRIALIQTTLPSLPEKVYEKGQNIQVDRLANYGLSLSQSCKVEHELPKLSQMIGDLSESNDLILILGASAICDRGDILPEAINHSGGIIEHFGMPVDPGNLLLLGRLEQTKIIGLPGCARSPALNGVDLILDRLFAGLPIDPTDIQSMGVGGLLKDSSGRGISRVEQSVEKTRRFAAIVLGGGLSTRMKTNKLLARWKGDQQVIDPVLS